MQESLTNVLKHAGATKAHVLIARRPNQVAVEVTDDGTGAANGRAGDSGNGLRGMRERVTALGGTFSAGPGERRWLRGACGAQPPGAPVTPPATVVRVLLADDQELVRDGFATILDLEDDLEVVGSVADGVAVITAARALEPDVVLMDVRMPLMDGIEATRRILAGSPVLPKVLVLTTFDLDEYVFAALQAGASGFLLKDTPRAGLLAAVRSVAAGDVLLSPVVTRRLVERFARRTPAVSTDEVAVAEPTGARRRGAHGSGALQRRDRGGARGQRGHREVACRPRVDQDRAARPGAGGCPRLRDRAGRAR